MMNRIFLFPSLLLIPVLLSTILSTHDIDAQDDGWTFVQKPLQLFQRSGGDSLMVPEFPTVPPTEELEQSEDEFPLVIEKVSDSAVGIASETSAAAPIGFGINPEFDGSGFVYDKKGQVAHIVTNEHVVSGFEEEQFYVYFQDGSSYIGNVVGTDPISDIAAIKIIYNGSQPLHALQLGNSSDLHVGDEVTAIGSPFIGSESIVNLVTRGIISKLGIEPVMGAELGSGSIIDAIVTDLAIQPGSSGGPLLNSQGQVVGIMTASEEAACCSYAVPSNTLSRIVPALIESGEYVHPYIGIIPISLNADPVARDLVPRHVQGVIVSTIDRDSPAHKSGIIASILNEFGELEYGDIITAVNKEPILTADEFDAAIDRYSVGDDIELTLYRNGSIEHAMVTLE